MVDIPVNDKDLLDLVTIQEDLCRHREGVEVAETPGGEIAYPLLYPRLGL